MPAFTVKTAAFDGPLDMLLTLIEDRKMLISDISLAQVADDFLAYISGQQSYPLSDTAQFLVVAATLLLIKSRALLPVLELTADEEGDIKDLERRLALLSIFRTASQQFDTQHPQFLAPGVTVRDPLFVPPPDVSLVSLEHAIRDVLAAAPRQAERIEVSVDPVISLDEMIDRLTTRVQRAIKLSFSEFTQGAANSMDVVVSFLAMLELVKRGCASVEQGAHFDEITIEYTGTIDAPRYE
jgi:segregation and condensation protein A